MSVKGIYNWTEPTPTKSGRDVIEIWHDLQDAWQDYKMYYYNRNDKINAVIKAKQIRRLQDDLGIKQDEFPELGIFD